MCAALNQGTKLKMCETLCAEQFVLTSDNHQDMSILVSYSITLGNYSQHLQHRIPFAKIPKCISIGINFEDVFQSLVHFIDETITTSALYCVPNVLFFGKMATFNIDWVAHICIDYFTYGVVFKGFYSMHRHDSAPYPNFMTMQCSGDNDIERFLLSFTSFQ